MPSFLQIFTNLKNYKYMFTFLWKYATYQLKCIWKFNVNSSNQVSNSTISKYNKHTQSTHIYQGNAVITNNKFSASLINIYFVLERWLFILYLEYELINKPLILVFTGDYKKYHLFNVYIYIKKSSIWFIFSLYYKITFMEKTWEKRNLILFLARINHIINTIYKKRASSVYKNYKKLISKNSLISKKII